MRWEFLALLAPGLFACDLNEGRREESREAVGAAREGRPPEAVKKQAEDLTTSAAADRAAVERDLQQSEAWVQRMRRDLASGVHAADARLESTLDGIEEDLRDIRGDLGRLAQSADDERKRLGESIHERLQDVARRVKELEEDERKPGTDARGPS